MSRNARRPSPDQMDVDIVDNDQWFDAHAVCHFKVMIGLSNITLQG